MNEHVELPDFIHVGALVKTTGDNTFCLVETIRFPTAYGNSWKIGVRLQGGSFREYYHTVFSPVYTPPCFELDTSVFKAQA